MHITPEVLVTLLLQLSVWRCVSVASLRGIGDAFELFSLSRFRSPMGRYPAAKDGVLPVTETVGGKVRGGYPGVFVRELQ